MQCDIFLSSITFCIFPKQIYGKYCNFPKQNTPDFYIFPKIFVGELLVAALSSMLKSASIVRNLSKNYTLRTIASILIYTLLRFHANFTILITQLQEARINLIGYNDSVIRPQLYPNGIILAQQIVVYIKHISQPYPQKTHEKHN